MVYPTLPALAGLTTVILLVTGSVAPGGTLAPANTAAPRRLGPFSLTEIAQPEFALDSIVAPAFEPSTASQRDSVKRAQSAGSLHSALVDRIHGASPALLTVADAPRAQALAPFVAAVEALAGTLPAATLVACLDKAALAECEEVVEAAGSDVRCIARTAAPSDPAWAAVSLVAEAVASGFAVIYSDVSRPLEADPRAALEPLKERALADAAAGTTEGDVASPASWDATIIAARNTPATRALLAAWLARADSGKNPAAELGAAATAARVVPPRLALRALPATAWAAPCSVSSSADAPIVRRAGACGSA